MLLDIRDQDSGEIFLWGVSHVGKRILVRIQDYRAYFYISCPRRKAETTAEPGATVISPDPCNYAQIVQSVHICYIRL